MEKICTRCKIKQDINNFHKANREPCGHVSNCRKCRSEILKNFNDRNPGKQLEYHKKWRENNRDKIHKHYNDNKEKLNKQARDRWKYNYKFREKVQNTLLKKLYGITLDDYNLMLEKQNGICAICGSKTNNSKRTEKFYIDHDHKTGKIRGLICYKCNTGLGCFNDNIELLKEAMNYLAIVTEENKPKCKCNENSQE